MTSQTDSPTTARGVEGDAGSAGGDGLATRYAETRQFSEFLCAPLETEDFVIQSMPDVSPTRWHLAHTTWFFETMVLARRKADYRPFHPEFGYLFNSYYNTVGEQFPRGRRGLLSRPTVKEVFAYRTYVDRHMRGLLNHPNDAIDPELADIVEIGLNHEQQHQELMLTDIKHVFSCNPLYPAYRPNERAGDGRATPALRWVPFEEGVHWIGRSGDGFAYDNEGPRHRALVHAFELADRLVTNGEYLEFMEDGGYSRPELWLSEGWATVQERGWSAPLYWQRRDGDWWNYTLGGLREVRGDEPVCHVSYYEADAYARWAGVWLPTEFAWEVAAERVAIDGNFVDSGHYHPAAPTAQTANGPFVQMFGDVWEWTCSPYVAYPGYRPQEGALGEYNGKFMCNQLVLRGGSCATSSAHLRRSYRNFFPASARWQFSGIRLSREIRSG